MTQPSNERWLPVVGYEGHYEVSDHGRVRSIKRSKSGMVMRLTVNKTRRVSVGLSLVGPEGWAQSTHEIHRLVLEAFVGPAPDGMEACHWDDNPGNNHLSNLRWATRSDNMHDLVRNGKHPNASKVRCKRGHEFTSGNTVVYADGRRECRTCRRNYQREYMRNRRALA